MQILCLKRAVEDNKGRFSEEAVNAVKEDFYVDDFFKSVKKEEEEEEEEEEGQSFVKEVTNLIREAGFRLTKWMSNSRSVLSTVPEKERARPTLNVDFDNLPVKRTLGVQ